MLKPIRVYAGEMPPEQNYRCRFRKKISFVPCHSIELQNGHGRAIGFVARISPDSVDGTRRASPTEPASPTIKDLKQRGLLDSTLVVWGGEFGRASVSELRRPDAPQTVGRNHFMEGFTVLLAGGGIKPGTIIGETDEFALHITEDRVHVHDLHATMLHCLGLDHKKLTYRYMGRDFLLTDVAGNVVRKLVA